MNDHITGAAGLWFLGQSLQLLGATGSGLTLMIVTVSIMLAYNTPALWKRLGHRAGSWFQSSEEAMMEEDAMDEAAMQQATANTARAAGLSFCSRSKGHHHRESASKTCLLASARDNLPARRSSTCPRGGHDRA